MRFLNMAIPTGTSLFQSKMGRKITWSPTQGALDFMVNQGELWNVLIIIVKTCIMQSRTMRLFSQFLSFFLMTTTEITFTTVVRTTIAICAKKYALS